MVKTLCQKKKKVVTQNDSFKNLIGICFCVNTYKLIIFISISSTKKLNFEIKLLLDNTVLTLSMSW